MVPANAPPQHRSLVFAPGKRTALAGGMDFVRTSLENLAAPPVTAADRRAAMDILLVACEILSNACAHTAGPVRMDLELEWGRLRISVTDPSPAPAARYEIHQPDLPYGHGLHIVETLALRWGCTPTGQGKVVWAVLPCPGF